MKKYLIPILILVSTTLFNCKGKDGDPGPAGKDGIDASNSLFIKMGFISSGTFEETIDLSAYDSRFKKNNGYLNVFVYYIDSNNEYILPLKFSNVEYLYTYTKDGKLTISAYKPDRSSLYNFISYNLSFKIVITESKFI